MQAQEQGAALPVPTPRHAGRAAARELADDPVARHARTAPSIRSSWPRSATITRRSSRTASTFELPLAELSYYWFGDHLLLWRPGDAPARDLSPGADDVGVRWLRETFAKLDGQPAPLAASTTYDDALEERVRAYQREHQLTIDGIVGARTQIAMLAELDLPEHAIARRGPLTCRSFSMHCASRSTSGSARQCPGSRKCRSLRRLRGYRAGRWS